MLTVTNISGYSGPWSNVNEEEFNIAKISRFEALPSVAV